MTSEHFASDSTPCASLRTLKIEETGDFFRNRVKPKIRLMGRWLEKAGFHPGGRVHVVCRAPGIIELRIPDAMNSNEAQPKAVVAKGVLLVDDFMKAGKFDAANDWLERGYRVYPGGSQEREAMVAKRHSLVEDIVKAGKLDRANDWLTTSFRLYPGGSTEEKEVVAKGVSLVDDFVKAGKSDAANVWLERGYNAFVSGSRERGAVAVKQEQLRQLRSSAQIGAATKMDFTALRAAVKQELARLQSVALL